MWFWKYFLKYFLVQVTYQNLTPEFILNEAALHSFPFRSDERETPTHTSVVSCRAETQDWRDPEETNWLLCADHIIIYLGKEQNYQMYRKNLLSKWKF